MRGLYGIGNWVLVIMASFISMIAALSLDSIISQELPTYGLTFNYSWAIPYWNMIALVFVMGWINIIAAIAFQIYRIRTIRKEEPDLDAVMICAESDESDKAEPIVTQQ